MPDDTVRSVPHRPRHLEISLPGRLARSAPFGPCGRTPAPAPSEAASEWRTHRRARDGEWLFVQAVIVSPRGVRCRFAPGLSLKRHPAHGRLHAGSGSQGTCAGDDGDGLPRPGPVAAAWRLSFNVLFLKIFNLQMRKWIIIVDLREFQYARSSM